MRILKVGSRDSKLAIAQTMLIIDEIHRSDPTLQVELITMKTTGDKILDRELEQVGGKGLFVRELDRALRNGEVDLTVHSLKDLPADLPEDLPLGAFSKRADPRDALLLAPRCSEADLMQKEAIIGSSGKRRIFQLKKLYPSASFQMMRGNVQTRLRKLSEENYTATVLAMAGLDRLKLGYLPSRIFSTEELIPAAGQGILAVQYRKGDHFSFLSEINAVSSEVCARAERTFVQELDGGCSSPIAAYAELSGQELCLHGLYVDETSGKSVQGIRAGSLDQAESIGKKLAEDLLKQVKEI